MSGVLSLSALAIACYLAGCERYERARERDRFQVRRSAGALAKVVAVVRRGILHAVNRISDDGRDEAQASLELQMRRDLERAGLWNVEDSDRVTPFVLTAVLSWPLLASLAWFLLPFDLASGVSVALLVFLLSLPFMRARGRTTNLRQANTSDVLLLCDQLACRAFGEHELVAIVSRLAAVMSRRPRSRQSSSPFLRELLRACYLTQQGYAWQQTLESAARRVQDELAERVFLCLAHAAQRLESQRSVLRGIADDAYRRQGIYAEQRLRAASLQATIMLVLSLVLAGWVFF